ncbi:hypothetical protein IWW50_000555 [Coemansia erecta]|nr:hypothetical protein GGF43_000614 [Coemansia sp. RSA 2618]KAJ2829955.1 hypothetical protein IWW50_000555 [Coemansia erecta]
MTLPVLFVTRELPALAQRRLDALTNVSVQQHKSVKAIDRRELLAGVAAADGLLCMLSDKIDDELLDAVSPSLKVISTCSVGYDHVDTALVKQRGLRLGFTPDVLTDATADTTVLLALMASRRAKEALDIVHSGRGGGFSLSTGLGTQFTNKTLGIVGLGRIGRATMHRLVPFGFTNVMYTARSARNDVDARHVTLPELLAESDLVCICCPLSPETVNMFDKHAFARMKSGAILVNTARGAIVNQDDLLTALESGQIAAAGLDVTVPEPLPSDHPLVKHPRCVVLPHIGSATEETRNAMANLAIDNALAGIFDRPLKAEVEL